MVMVNCGRTQTWVVCDDRKHSDQNAYQTYSRGLLQTYSRGTMSQDSCQGVPQKQLLLSGIVQTIEHVGTLNTNNFDIALWLKMLWKRKPKNTQHHYQQNVVGKKLDNLHIVWEHNCFLWIDLQ